jgi:hypothetical protein
MNREKKMDRPKVLDNIDWDEVKEIAKQYLDEVEYDGVEDSDTPHYIFEAVMMAIYGPKVFDWEAQVEDEQDEEDE